MEVGVEGFGGRSGNGWRDRRERLSCLHLGGKVPHIGRAGGVGRRSGCWYPLMRRRLGWASLVWFRLNRGLLQLLLRILLPSSLSSSSPFATSTQAPTTALLLLILELWGLVPCRFNRAEFVCSLLVISGHTCSPVSLPRGPHHMDYLFRY